MASILLSDRCLDFYKHVRKYKENGYYPYFRPIKETSGSAVAVNGKGLIMISSNDYLGLTHDEAVIERTQSIIGKFGTGTGGSRFLCGNLELHKELEFELAEFVGKKRALVFPTGFTTNLGVISSLLTTRDVVLFDRENHASIYDACKMTKARIITFTNNDVDSALKKLDKLERAKDSIVLLITEGVFSMSGNVADLPNFVSLKDKAEELYIYLDDAHGLGTMGPGGRGVSSYFKVEGDVDFIMGTFSKSFGSIGGFVACDDEQVAEYLQHQARTMIFSASLPAGNVATVLACLDKIKREPDRVDRLWDNIHYVRQGYAKIGMKLNKQLSPIIPIHIGRDDLAIKISYDLFQEGIFALPVLYPAVRRGEAIIRTSFMATHTKEQLDTFLLALHKVLKKNHIVE